MVNENEIFLDELKFKYGFHCLNAIKTLQEQIGNKTGIGVQPKYIVKKLEPILSHQTVYVTLHALVEGGFLIVVSDGKFKFYSLTNEGKNLLRELKETQQKMVTEPFVKNIANKLKEDYPEEFNDIDYNVLIDYLYKRIKKFESLTINDAIRYFLNETKEDSKVDVV